MVKMVALCRLNGCAYFDTDFADADFADADFGTTTHLLEQLALLLTRQRCHKVRLEIALVLRDTVREYGSYNRHGSGVWFVQFGWEYGSYNLASSMVRTIWLRVWLGV